jgi:GNAT superfamily N-acetyltransferase
MVGSNEPEREWSVREYREGDEEQILELRGIVLSGSRDKEWWQWMYRDGPLGPATIMVAEVNQRIIGTSGSILVPLKVGDQITRGSHGIDLMVHPDYRRQGIMKALSAKLRESSRGMKKSIGYGTPNNESYQGFVKRMGALDIGELPFLFKVINWGALLKNRYKIPVFAGKLFGYTWERITNRPLSLKDAEIEVEEVFSFDERIDKFCQKASEIKAIMVMKNMKYLNWRYVAKPGKEYKILLAKKHQEITGFIVLKLEKNILFRGYIVDLLTLPGEDIVAEVLITRAMKYFKEEGAATISCWMFQDIPYYKILRKLGFLRRSGPRFCIRIIDPNIPKEFATNPANWYYVVGDGDSL